MPPKTKYDPLEAAKVTPASMSRDDDVTQASPAQPAQSVAYGAVPQATPAAPAKTSQKPVVQPTPPPAAPAPRTLYRVVAERTLSIRGQMNRLPAGMMIDPEGYGGEEGIERLQKLGLQLEKVTE